MGSYHFQDRGIWPAALGHTLVSAPRDEIAVQISMSAQCFLRGGEEKREKEKTNGNSVKGVLPFCSMFVHLSFFPDTFGLLYWRLLQWKAVPYMNLLEHSGLNRFCHCVAAASQLRKLKGELWASSSALGLLELLRQSARMSWGSLKNTTRTVMLSLDPFSLAAATSLSAAFSPTPLVCIKWSRTKSTTSWGLMASKNPSQARSK